MSVELSARMSERSRRRLVWTAPLLVAGLVAAGVAVTSTSASGASPKLAPRTVAQLLTAVQGSDATALSGKITETANLGIPTLPGADSGASLNWQTFVSGSHSAKVWVGGADKQRIALIGELSEAEVVHNGRDVWTYTSDTNTVSHSVLPNRTDEPKRSVAPQASDMTPAAVTDRVLKAVRPSTSVRVESSRMVADRKAYTLVVRPRDKNSTVRKVSIAIDATKFVPLQVKIYGTGSSPAFQVGFDNISFGTPAASTFRFTAPKGASVTTDPLGRTGRRHGEGDHGAVHPAAPRHRADPAGAPKVIGSGWTAVLELPSGTASNLGNGILRDLTSAVGTSGARLLHTALVNAVLLPDGRSFVGAVSPTLLERIAATTPR